MNGVVVVDASLALKWVLDEEDSDLADRLLDGWINEGVDVIAPALLAYEIANTLHRQVVKGKLTYEEVRQALTDLFATGVLLKFSLHEDISAQAMEFAHEFGLPATYDAHYLALAHSEDCEFWTADARLWNAVKGKLSWVRWFSDYQPL